MVMYIPLPDAESAEWPLEAPFTRPVPPLPDWSHASPRRGMVYLIGAGPGDPELITLKGLRCLRAADTIIYDRLISPLLLDEAPAHAERIFAGKSPRHHTLSQGQINSLLVERSLQGRVVVRLKGGDPFVFGRGGEEAEALAAHGIPFEVVPGVSSAVAVPAYAGIPVTHRGHASALGGTLVVMMGVAALPRITQELLDGGLDPRTPAAVIQQGTVPQQRVVTGTVATIATRAIEAGLRTPAITVIGAVAGLRDTLAWFEKSPSYVAAQYPGGIPVRAIAEYA
jgi:uroporphyrin-III C-methyltransferase